MFEQVEEYPVDPIMIGADYFAADPRKDKLNLTVGIYQDEQGQTPVLEAASWPNKSWSRPANPTSP